MRLMFFILFDTSDFYGPYSLIVTMWTVKLILQIEKKKTYQIYSEKNMQFDWFDRDVEIFVTSIDENFIIL